MEFQTSGVTENRESYVILIINTGVVVKHETCTAADLSTKNKCYNILKLPPFLWPFLNTILVFRRNTFLVEGIEDLLAQSLRTWVQWMYITYTTSITVLQCQTFNKKQCIFCYLPSPSSELYKICQTSRGVARSCKIRQLHFPPFTPGEADIPTYLIRYFQYGNVYTSMQYFSKLHILS